MKFAHLALLVSIVVHGAFFVAILAAALSIELRAKVWALLAIWGAGNLLGVFGMALLLNDADELFPPKD